MVCIFFIEMRRDTLTGAIDVICNCSIALNGYITIATSLQYRRHFLFIKAIFAHRGDLSTTIDTMTHMSILVNGDCSITTHQSRVAMSLYAGTATEDATIDSGLTFNTSFSWCNADLHFCVSFHTANLTAAINITIHGTVDNTDIRAVRNTFLTPEGVVLTLACSEHITFNDSRTAIDCHIANACVLTIASSIDRSVSIFPSKRPHVIRHGIRSYTA